MIRNKDKDRDKDKDTRKSLYYTEYQMRFILVWAVGPFILD